MMLNTTMQTQTDPHPRVIEWWRGATIYQIYPRSFMDSNGDGIGDMPGITARLDHVASLGVDGIWISPFFTSPMRDFGYDVADYCDVDPIFGTLADFDALVERAHKLGLKVLIDLVFSHSSDQHSWFVDSRSSRKAKHADWYVWADAKADGSPPTNWQSVFGGPAWTWDARRGQYYLHNFLREQPQLNLHNGDVQQSLLDATRFWLDRGVDGFRMDAVNFGMHDLELRDNPPAPQTGATRTRPFDFQIKKYNQSHPDIVCWIERVRALIDSYDDRFTVAEVGGDDSEREMKLFTADNKRLHSAYGFDFLYADALTPRAIVDALAKWPDEPGIGWPSWAFENHDAPRAISRWVAPERRDAFARMKILLLASLRGNIFIYQGEELGLTQVDIPFEHLQDPEAIANWPLTLSRDGARTPMPWTAQDADLGFGSEQPWLPTCPQHRTLAVDVQRADPHSLLNLTHRIIAFRQDSAPLRVGAIDIVHCDEHLLAFERRTDDETLLCLFNLGETPQSWPADVAANGAVCLSVNAADVSHVPAYGALIIRR